ncbi:peptidoglycan-binding domain-containing protein [Streptomyces paludis]|uniref:Peptidoglycan-binding protein n=1 Tax=Streptomyces paludis TaxID=2282738 RepID=A0A345HLI1_9ACTN|nr:peptidoglycan-binding domain-containing protein [Streptomyces paludis]AXG77555.1 peptidoglycan-binding protein [Streptomyces paludis]
MTRLGRVRRLSGRKKLGVVVGVVVLVGAGGWVAGTQVRSPADAAAARRPPEAGPVTVKVGRQSLTATVVATGSVEFASPRPLALAGQVGAGAAGGAGGEAAGEQRVTRPPVAGTKVEEGDVLMMVNGRPVFALAGTVPMYRALGPGASGDDVRQLQKALRRLGFDPGAASGAYRQGTAGSVTRWYASKGHQAQQPSLADRQQLGALEESVSAAQQALLLANDSGAGGGAGGGAGSDVSEEDGAASPPAESAAQRQVRQLQLSSARKSLDLANAALGSFRESYGTKVPAGEVVFFPKLPVRLDKVTVKAGDSPSGPVGTVTSSDVVVETVVPGSDAALLSKGMAVELTTAAGEKAVGTVSALGADAAATSSTAGSAGSEESEGSTGSAGAGSPGGEEEPDGATDPTAPVQLRISVPDPGPLAGQASASVKVTIKIGASAGKVLTVPLAAIRTAADGQARVRVRRGDGTADVRVTVGLSAAGLVEVKPVDGGKLSQDDEVVVGE